MKFKGFKLNSLSEMKPGNMYVFVDNASYDNYSDPMKSMYQQKAWAFTYEGSAVPEFDGDINYDCNLLANSNRMILRSSDQELMDKGQCILYTLEEM